MARNNPIAEMCIAFDDAHEAEFGQRPIFNRAEGEEYRMVQAVQCLADWFEQKGRGWHKRNDLLITAEMLREIAK